MKIVHISDLHLTSSAFVPEWGDQVVIWKLENSYFITAGTATTRRLKGRSYPSFNVLEIAEGIASLKEVNVAQGSLKEILSSIHLIH